MKYASSFFRRLFPVLSPIGLTILFLVPIHGQTATTTMAAASGPQSAAAAVVLNPIVRDVEGLTLGMTENEIRSKLGRPETADNTGMFYDRRKGPNVQLSFDAKGKADRIAVMYSAKDTNAPDIAQVLGPDYKYDPSPDGKIFEKVRYVQAGYSVTYSRIKLSDGFMTTITLHRLGSEPF